MLSIETAKALKEAGLVWGPQDGDLFYWRGGTQLVDMFDLTRVQILSASKTGAIWLPRLDQLLAEIEKRGYGWKLEKFHSYGPRRMQIYKVNDFFGCFEADTPEEAAAQALLWIIEQEARSDG